MPELKSYTSLINSHVNETIFILGAGTSLHSAMQSPLFNRIFDQVVIAVNSSIMATSWVDKDPGANIKRNRLFLSNDALCRRWSYWNTVKQCNAIKIVRDSWLKYIDELTDFLIFSPRPTPEDVINPEDTGLAYCSSVPTAIDLAIQMGCSKIYILGLDHYMTGKYSHFWQLWPRNKWPTRTDSILAMATHAQQQKVFPVNMKAFSALNGFADIKNVKVYNCNPLSKVECFEKIKFEETMKQVS